MIYSSCLTDEDRLLVLDASVVINLLATGCAKDILSALNRPILLPEAVLREVENGEQRGHGVATTCQELLVEGRVTVVDLDAASLPLFMDLVGGTTSSSLGDGEAATIAIASTRPGCAVIDEKKATKLLSARFAHIGVATTIDLLSHESIVRGIGRDRLAAGTLSALNVARMQIRAAQFSWLQDVIGENAVASCPGLKRFVAMRNVGVA